MNTGLDHFFRAQSIVVVGASADPGKAGYQIAKNLLESTYKGRIYLVNPKLDTLLGRPCHSSVTAIQDDIELAIVTVPAKAVPGVFRELKEKATVKAVVCVASGFSETKTETGLCLEREILATAEEGGFRVMGPNCVGVIDVNTGVDTTFASGIAKIPGGMSVISQSGAFGAGMMVFATRSPVPMGFSKWAHVGNQKDVTVQEILRYYRDDNATKVIAMYMEGLENAREFLEVAREVAETKAVLVLKVGRSSIGANAAASHTGSLAGADAIYKGAFAQSGVQRMLTMTEMLDTAKALSMQPLPAGNRVAVLTEAGGPGIVGMDELGLSGDAVSATFSNATIEALKDLLPDMAIVDHIPGYVDMTAAANEEHHALAMDIILKDSGVDAVVHFSVPPTFIDPVEMARKTADVLRNTEKPVTVCYMGGDGVPEAMRVLEQSGVPCYDMPDRAARAMVNILRRKKILEQLDKCGGFGQGAPVSVASKKMLAVAAADKGALTEVQARQILKDAGIPLLQAEMAVDADAAADIADRLGFPLVMKIVSPDILHKSDVGGVCVNIQSADAAREAYTTITEGAKAAVPYAVIQGVLLMEQAPHGPELIIGGLRDAQFGPTIMVGFGGIHVEILEDVALAMAPVTPERAMLMIRSLKMYPTLTGIRGATPCDCEALALLVSHVSQLMARESSIREIDLNPVRAYPDGVRILDARIIVQQADNS